MSTPVLKRLLREWAALVAVLALVLGPLALGVQRSLGTSDRIVLASGAKPLALCLPSMPNADPSSGGGQSCDHCTAAQPCVIPALANGVATQSAQSNYIAPVSGVHVAPPARAPPARGPPAA